MAMVVACVMAPVNGDERGGDRRGVVC